MKKFATFFILVIIISSCTKPDRTQPLVFDYLKSEKKIYALNDSSMPYMTLDFEFTYPVSFRNDTMLAEIQKVFVNAFAGEEYIGRSPKGAFEAFEKSMMDESLDLAMEVGDELPDFSEYYQKVKTEVLDTTYNIATVKTEISSYMGGAHDSYNVLYYNIDLTNGKIIKENTLFKGNQENTLSVLLVQALKSKYGDSIKDVLFDVDEVKPNGNFYFTKEGLMYVFNEYEIAPYSTGLVEVLLPADKIKKLLVKDYSRKLK